MPFSAAAQQPDTVVAPALLQQVLPQADSISGRQGNPPVYRAYRTDPASGLKLLVGFGFLTSDWPPEERGYGGPIRVLVGMDLAGTITGARVISYWEPIRAELGDFLHEPGMQEQYQGKHISDPFQLYTDIKGVSRATITVSAMARTIQASARRVAIALSPTALFGVAPGGTAEPVSTRRRLEEMSWADMAKIGIVRRIEVAGRGVSAFEFTLTYLGDEWLGRLLLGESYGPVVTAGGSKNDHAFAVGMYGSGSFNPAALTLRQHGVTFKVSPDDFVALGMPNQGKIANQALRIGVLTIDRSIDLAQPFGIDYDAGAPVGVISSEYAFPRELLPIAQTTPIPAWMEKIAAQSATTQATTPAAGAPATSSGGAPAAGPTPRAASASTQVPRGETSANAPTAPAVAQPAAASANIPGLTQFRVVEEDTPLKRFWAATRWSRVVPLLLLFTLVMYAFLRKNISARWVALAGTVVFLGFVDGGFLSVSLITSVIAVGPSLLLRDLPLLLVVVFTVVTTLLWGRVLCGFLCPFGALQEFLERLVPRRFQVKVPRRVHLSARYLKYAILAFIVILAVVNSQVTIYQYFEPFGTVFFRSRSVLLWGIAIAFLAASAVVPRFYCRYVCPLGAGLGIASLPALFRIKRVDPCTQCLICEKGCPTGAIRKEEIDFTECVRCGTCEVKLLTQAGVCRKLSRADLLVQMERPRRALSSARQAARVTTHE